MYKLLISVACLCVLALPVGAQTWTVVYEDAFDGADGTAANAAWSYNAGGENAHNGAGQYLLKSGASAPFASYISGLNSTDGLKINMQPNGAALPGVEDDYRMELWLTVPANTLVYFHKTDFSNWGFLDIVTSIGPGSTGNIVLSGWQGASLEDTGIAYPADTSFGVRMTMNAPPSGDIVGTMIYEYNIGAGWVVYTPTNATYSEYYIDPTVTNQTVPMIMNQSASTDALLDSFKLETTATAVEDWELF